MKSTIFINDLTCLDCAVVNNDGYIEGASFLVTAHLTGDVTSDESVVLDFSKAKKAIKSLIDGPSGLDHKLLIKKETEVDIENIDGLSSTLTSTHFNLICPNDSFQVIDTNIVEYIQKLVEDFYKEEGIKCRIFLDRYSNSISENAIYFTYSHGLKKSSAYGCQNIGHGHRSFVEVYDENGDFNYELTEEIANHFDEKILINKENIISQNEKEITIGYDCSRGYYEITYKFPHRWLVLDSETTIECIGEYIKQKFDIEGKALYISEGLQKGILIYG